MRSLSASAVALLSAFGWGNLGFIIGTALLIPLGLGLEAIARRKNATLAQLSIAWPMAQGKRAGVFILDQGVGSHK